MATVTTKPQLCPGNEPGLRPRACPREMTRAWARADGGPSTGEGLVVMETGAQACSQPSDFFFTWCIASLCVCRCMCVCARADTRAGVRSETSFRHSGTFFTFPKHGTTEGAARLFSATYKSFWPFFFFFFNIKPEEINKINASVRAT